ncbi:hypothetical protein [Streptomyces sp. NPDC086777]|uniref:hypothetical protein n=1 Tax=Streptomyces sp. NPDC086777 TaxID=3154866 RepID=UPI00344EC133
MRPPAPADGGDARRHPLAAAQVPHDPGTRRRDRSSFQAGLRTKTRWTAFHVPAPGVVPAATADGAVLGVAPSATAPAAVVSRARVSCLRDPPRDDQDRNEAEAWFIEPALYAFGRRQVAAALLNHALPGTDAEQAGAERACYCAHLPLRADRSPAYAPSGSRDPALDDSHDVVDKWLQGTISPDRNES